MPIDPLVIFAIVHFPFLRAVAAVLPFQPPAEVVVEVFAPLLVGLRLRVSNRW